MMKNQISQIKVGFRRQPTTTCSPRMINPQLTSPKIYNAASLPGLPQDLLFMICDFLLPIDLKCLSLCDRRFFSLLHQRYNNLPPLIGDEKFLILTRLQRDMTNHFTCHICNKLHHYDGSKSFGLSGIAHRKTSKLPCDNKRYKLKSELKDGVGMSLRTHTQFEHSRCRLSIHQLKLAMRAFHYPGSVTTGISTDSLSYTQVLRYKLPIHYPDDPEEPDTHAPPITTLFSIEAQICPKPLGLHIRMQDIMLLSTWDDSRIATGKKPLDLYEICCHAPVLRKDLKAELDKVYDGTNDFFSYTCPQCNTNCMIEILKFESRIAFIMTRWMNLGPGLDHNDPLWKTRVWGTSTNPRLPASMMVTNPSCYFEDLASETHLDLKERNLSYLKGNRYVLEPFVRLGRHLWHISYQDSATEKHESKWPWLRVFHRSHCSSPRMGPIVIPGEVDGRSKRSSSDEWFTMSLWMSHVPGSFDPIFPFHL